MGSWINHANRMMKLIVCSLVPLVVLTSVIAAPFPQETDDSNAFWIGTQDLTCLKSKGALKVKRSTDQFDGEQRSTIEYAHRLLYYHGQVYEWGAGTRGYHFGPTASISDCDVVWEDQPAGTSHCPYDVLERFTQNYRVRYGGYNMVTNNCHHYVNRLGMLLLSDTCEIGEDRWLRFERKFGSFLKRFMAIFNPGSDEHPDESQQEGNPHNVNDWPVEQWYKRK